ncbi:hypothetical protein [Nostoc sp. 'Peltigera malacea cyanobiont' DB3992]|nr:hypothetical protein [Nostoc sp. 'Peltigera malacea cyanobiont' DB3992]
MTLQYQIGRTSLRQCDRSQATEIACIVVNLNQIITTFPANL